MSKQPQRKFVNKNIGIAKTRRMGEKCGKNIVDFSGKLKTVHTSNTNWLIRVDKTKRAWWLGHGYVYAQTKIARSCGKFLKLTTVVNFIGNWWYAWAPRRAFFPLYPLLCKPIKAPIAFRYQQTKDVTRSTWKPEPIRAAFVSPAIGSVCACVLTRIVVCHEMYRGRKNCNNSFPQKPC